MDAGIFLSTSVFGSLSPSVQSAIFKAAGLAVPKEMAAPDHDTPSTAEYEGGDGGGFQASSSEESDDIAQFSDRQMRKFLEKMHPKTRSVLDVIADIGPKFTFGELLGRLDIPVDEWKSLSGVWSGLTKRTRSIGNDPGLYLFRWPNYHLTENTEEVIGEMNPLTHQALRKALNK